MVVVGLVILAVGVAQADPQDWGPPTGLPTIDAWRHAGRQNDRDREREYWNYYDGLGRGGYDSYGYNGGGYGGGYPGGGYGCGPQNSITIWGIGKKGGGGFSIQY